VIDDNIAHFARLHLNQRIPVGDGTIFHAIEEFAGRYKAIALAAPHYWMFAPSRSKKPPFITGTRVQSCILIRNDIPFRWRARYNEDVDLSIRVLKAGWQTILFNAFLQCKVTTQVMPGGNTEAFYAVEGTLAKSRMLADLHPDVVKVVRRYNRWHHHVNYSQWRNTPLLRRDDYQPGAKADYQLSRRPIDKDAAEYGHVRQVLKDGQAREMKLYPTANPYRMVKRPIDKSNPHWGPTKDLRPLEERRVDGEFQPPSGRKRTEAGPQ
jgi:hypothetical protein